MSSAAKIVTTSTIKNIRAGFRDKGITLGVCHGCFDILHSGHVHYLTQASQRCDVLVVSITTAQHVNKGPDRPVFDDQARASVAAAISVVDYVVLNDHATAVPLIRELEPDFYFKGADYVSNDDIRLKEELEAVREVGGQVMFTNDEVFDSSTRAVLAMQGS